MRLWQHLTFLSVSSWIAVLWRNFSTHPNQHCFAMNVVAQNREKNLYFFLVLTLIVEAMSCAWNISYCLPVWVITSEIIHDGSILSFHLKLPSVRTAKGEIFVAVDLFTSLSSHVTMKYCSCSHLTLCWRFFCLNLEHKTIDNLLNAISMYMVLYLINSEIQSCKACHLAFLHKCLRVWSCYYKSSNCIMQYKNFKRQIFIWFSVAFHYSVDFCQIIKFLL